MERKKKEENGRHRTEGVRPIFHSVPRSRAIGNGQLDPGAAKVASPQVFGESN
jgi:hypothetical protein